VLFALQAPDLLSPPDWPSAWRLLPRQSDDAGLLDPKLPALLALALVVPIGVPVIPPVFNWLVGRIAVPFRDDAAAPLPRFRVTCLLQGLVLSTGCWLFFGASVWAMLQGVMDRPPQWSWNVWGHYTAIMALAYVAGFVIVFVPSGLGVREFFLLLFLTPVVSKHLTPAEPDARALATLAVGLLRLVWTAAEVVIVAFIYWLPSSANESAPAFAPQAAKCGPDSTNS
jgi:hypothetical protein